MLPDSPQVNETIVGVVARGQRVYDMAIHGVAFLSNHFHMVVTGRNPEQVAGFMQYVKANLTRRINKIRARSGTMWHRRYDLVPVEAEQHAQVQVLAYVLAHGAKEGLVSRAEDWPGISSTAELIAGAKAQTGMWGTREKRDAVSIQLTPLPGAKWESAEQRRAELQCAMDACVARSEAPDPGPDAARRLKRGDWRTTVDEPQGRREPHDGGGRKMPESFRAAYDEIVARYTAAARAHVEGEACEFPAWTFPRWQRMGGAHGTRYGRMNKRERDEWRRRKTNGIYGTGSDPPRRE